jgi:hypothetical protein
MSLVITPPENRLEHHLREEAIDRVAHALYGDAFVPSASVREFQLDENEWKLVQRGDLPISIKDARRAAILRFCWVSYRDQQGTVIRWLQRQHGIDCSVNGFDPEAFETFWTEHFGGEPSPEELRKVAVAKLLDEGRRPPDNIGWKEFRKLVEAACGDYSEKTIQRDVKEWREARWMIGHFSKVPIPQPPNKK